MQEVAANQKFTSRTRVFSTSILKLFLDFLEKTRNNLTPIGVEVVPQIVLSAQTRFQQKILQFGCARAQKLPTVRYARMRSSTATQFFAEKQFDLIVQP